jgi:hypothetical protein
MWLAVPLDDGQELALCDLSAQQEGALRWQTVKLRERLQGRPAICGDFLVFPAADGTLDRVPLKAGVRRPPNPVTEYWMPSQRPGENRLPGPETASIHPLGPSEILLTAAGRSIRRMEVYEQDNVTQWRQVGGEFSSDARLVGETLVIGDRALVADEAGHVHSFDVADPGKTRGFWRLGGRPTGEPFLRGDKLVAIVDGRKLVCIDPQAAGSDQPLWSTDPLRGRIRGQPALDGDLLLVAEESRRSTPAIVTAIRLDDGQPAWSVRVPARIGPAAAAVPFGPDRILVPLADGTFSIVRKPAEEKQP